MSVDVSNILEKYFAAARAARDGEFFVQCRQRKPYLTREVIERWGIGKAPTLKQCMAAGLTVEELSSVGLLRQGEHGGAYMHFRDAMLFPYTERGRIVYLSSRRLVDHDPKTGEALDKSKKALCPPSPNSQGHGGLARPACFNADALGETPAPLAIVEGCADAIACCERGLMAVAQVGGSIREDLAMRLRGLYPAGDGVYVAPDATADVTPRKRAELAGAVGPCARVVLLPDGKDPDDIAKEDWAALIVSAPDALTCWIGLFAGDPSAWPADLSDDFKKVVNAWLQDAFTRQDVDLEGHIRGKVCEAFAMRDAEMEEWLVPKALGPGGGGGSLREAPKPFRISPKAGALKPLPPAPAAPHDGGPSNLPEIRNWKLEERSTPKGPKQMRIALDLEEVKAQLLDVLCGWPARIHSPGAKRPLLFVHLEGARRVVWFQDGEDLESFLKRRAQLFFETERDYDGKRFVTVSNLYRHMGLEPDVPEFLAVEYFPHVPPIEGHYYLGRVDAQRKRKPGDALYEYLSHFQNVEDDASRVIVAAGVLGTYWGGPYGQRPIIVAEARVQGSGKSTYAKKTCRLAGGYIKANLAEKGEEKELVQRFMSPRGLEKRGVLWDNIESTRVVKNNWLESTVTDDEISGKRMYLGEAERPNSLCWWLTVNNARLSPDIARRSFSARFAKPEYYADYEEKLEAFIKEARYEIADDCADILSQPPPNEPWGQAEESFALWTREVLARAWGWLTARGMIDSSLEDVLRQNAAWRNDRNEDISEAQTILHELLERVARDRNYIGEDDQLNVLHSNVERALPNYLLKHDEFIPTIKRAGESSPAMVNYLESILNRREVNSKWVSNTLGQHIETGRMKGLRAGHLRKRRGWFLARQTLAAYLDDYRATQEREAKEKAEAEERASQEGKGEA